MTGLPADRTDAAADTAQAMRTVLRNVPTSIAVVAGLDATGRPVGLAVGTFTSVSLEPPLVAFCPGSESMSWPRIRPTGRFCINVLGIGQDAVCTAFAAKGENKFEGLDWQPSVNGAPRIPGSVAHLDCDLEVEHVAGDHTVVIGRVTAIEAGGSATPLVFLKGRLIGVR